MSDATSGTGTRPAAPSNHDARFSVPPMPIHRVEADDVQLFHHTAGPVVLAGHSYGGAVISGTRDQCVWRPEGRLP